MGSSSEPTAVDLKYPKSFDEIGIAAVRSETGWANTQRGRKDRLQSGASVLATFRFLVFFPPNFA